jgi:hypothetical protein
MAEALLFGLLRERFGEDVVRARSELASPLMRVSARRSARELRLPARHHRHR